MSVHFGDETLCNAAVWWYHGNVFENCCKSVGVSSYPRGLLNVKQRCFVTKYCFRYKMCKVLQQFYVAVQHLKEISERSSLTYLPLIPANSKSFQLKSYRELGGLSRRMCSRKRDWFVYYSNSGLDNRGRAMRHPGWSAAERSRYFV